MQLQKPLLPPGSTPSHHGRAPHCCSRFSLAVRRFVAGRGAWGVSATLAALLIAYATIFLLSTRLAASGAPHKAADHTSPMPMLPPATPSPSPQSSPPPVHRSAAGSKCSDASSCLYIIDNFFTSQPRNGAGLMQTYGPDSFSGGPCGDKMCKLVEPCPSFALQGHCG